MLTKRIIPCLDVDNGKVVKGTNFVNLSDAGDPVELARHYNNEGADELVFLDITATVEKRETVRKLASSVASQIFIPFTIGGGIKTVDDIEAILMNGADKAAINTAAVTTPGLIDESAKLFGSQCIVVAVDVKRENGSWEVYINGGRKATGLDAEKWIHELQERGAGEILLTSIDRDGQKVGCDLEILKNVSEKLSIPVIASGGIGELRHFADAISIGSADAVLAASVFHYGKFTFRQVKEYLKEEGIQVRELL